MHRSHCTTMGSFILVRVSPNAVSELALAQIPYADLAIFTPGRGELTVGCDRDGGHCPRMAEVVFEFELFHVGRFETTETAWFDVDGPKKRRAVGTTSE